MKKTGRIIKNTYTQDEAEKIRALIKEKQSADTNKQKSIRNKIRNIGFYFEDFYTKGRDIYDVKCFDDLIESGKILIK